MHIKNIFYSTLAVCITQPSYPMLSSNQSLTHMLPIEPPCLIPYMVPLSGTPSLRTLAMQSVTGILFKNPAQRSHIKLLPQDLQAPIIHCLRKLDIFKKENQEKLHTTRWATIVSACLYNAIETDNLEIPRNPILYIGILIQAGANVNYRNPNFLNGITPLIWAIKRNNPWAVKILLCNPNIDPYLSVKSTSPFAHVVFHNYHLLADLFFDCPRIDWSRYEMNITLHDALSHNDCKLLQRMLAHKCTDPNIQTFDAYQETALVKALKQGNDAALQHLVSHPKIRFDNQNDQGKTIFEILEQWHTIEDESIPINTIKYSKPDQYARCLKLLNTTQTRAK